MRTLLLDVYNESVRILDVDPHDLDMFHRKLDCRCIDIVTRKVGGVTFDIVCDDEGLFHDPQKISAADKNGQPMLVGNLMFFHHEGAELTELSEDDCNTILENIAFASTEQFPCAYPVIFGME